MKIKCCLVFGGLINFKKIWKIIKQLMKKYCTYILIWGLLIGLVFLPLFAIVLGYDSYPLLPDAWFNALCDLYSSSDGFNLVNVVTFVGASIALTLFSLRNKAMTAQTKSQYEIFNEDKQFSNFLEATKLLTDKDSTAEAKIAAIFSLADVAKAHPKHLDRIIQVLNKELIPLIKAIDGKNNTDKHTFTLQEKKVVKKPLALKKETGLFSCTQNKIVSYDKEAKTNQKNIKDWQHKGSETEKVVSVALYVIRKIILELEKLDSSFDFSNTIFFNIDDAFDRKSIGKKFIRKDDKRIENAIFLDCKLKGVDFSKTNFHYCKFINCDLSNANFMGANLWGTSFNNCNLENTIFKEAECEGLDLINCKKLTINQLGEMKFCNLGKVRKYIFKNENGQGRKNSNLKYLIIIDKKTLKNNPLNLSLDNVLTSSEYSEWKNSDKS